MIKELKELVDRLIQLKITKQKGLEEVI